MERKGAGIGRARSNLLANIRKDEININNVSNLVMNISTTQYKHPNKSQLDSMEHELSVIRAQTKSCDVDGKVIDKNVNEILHDDQDYFLQKGEDEEESLTP